jgi:hypothetical protein
VLGIKLVNPLKIDLKQPVLENNNKLKLLSLKGRIPYLVVLLIGSSQEISAKKNIKKKSLQLWVSITL